MSKNKKHGNETRSEDMPYQPLPEITTPGIRTNYDDNESSENFQDNDEQNQKLLNPDHEHEVDYYDLESMRRWEEDHEM